MCVMTSWDLNVYIRWKNIKLCPPIESLPTTPLVGTIMQMENGTDDIIAKGVKIE